MTPRAKRLSVLLLPLIIAAGGLWLRLTKFATVDPHQQADVRVGEVLAERAAQLLGGRGRIVVLSFHQAENPAVNTQTTAFLAAVRRTGALTVVATEFVSAGDQSRKGVQRGLDPQRLLAVVQAHPDANAIVSFVGAPPLTEKLRTQWTAQSPKFLAVSLVRKELAALLGGQVLQVAIVPRFQYPAPVSENPHTAREWFDQFYQVVTTAAELPAHD